MKSIKHYRKDFLNYLNDTLSDQAKAEFEASLKESLELQAELENYRRVVQMEKETAKEHFELDERFVSKVMAEIKHNQSPLRRILMKIKSPNRTVAAALGGFTVIALCISLAYGPAYEEYKLKISNQEPAVEDSSIGEPSLSTESDEAAGAKVEVHETLPEELSHISPELLKPLEDNRNRQNTTSSMQDSDGQVTVNDLFGGAPNRGGHITVDHLFGGSSDKESVSEAAGEPRSKRAPMADIMPYPMPSVPSSGERYGQLGENHPIMTSVEPMSTFSIDVDTGSYTNSRRFLQQGQLPPSAAVRVEEFINYFDYDYPSQSDQAFTANFEIAPSPGHNGAHLLKIGIKAKESVSDANETPWNLVFLIDVSGSMNHPQKLPLVQSSLELLANKMRAGDRVSIVTYAGSSRVALPPTGVEKKSDILRAITTLQSGGSTHGAAGINQAYDLAEQSFIKGGINRVLLATDGDFNVGMTSNQDLINLIQQKRKSGITLTTLGYGSGNYNEAMMEQLANKGNGNYFYIDNFREARKVFEEDLYGTLEVVAKDVKLQIEFNPEHVAQYRLIGYENRALQNQDFANDKVDAGEIGAGHTVTALYEIILAGSKAAEKLSPTYRYKQEEKVEKQPESHFSDELAFLKIRHKQPEGTKSTELTFPLNRSSVKNDLSQASDDFQFAAAVSAFAQKLRGGQYAPDLSFNQVIELATKGKGQDKRGFRQEFIELVKNANAVEKK